MGPIGFPETSVNNYHSTLRHILEKRISRLHVFIGCLQNLLWQLEAFPLCYLYRTFSSLYKIVIRQMYALYYLLFNVHFFISKK
jgi:hypothetical protein